MKINNKNSKTKRKLVVTNDVSILLGKNIVYFRQLPENNLSQSDLAHKLGTNKSYVSQVENAKRNVSTDYIDRLCKVFNIKPVELFTERDFNPKPRIDSRK